MVSAPPSSSSRLPHQPTATNQLPPTNCHQPIVNNQLPPTNCHQPIATHQLPPTICHQPIVINQLSSTNCHQPIATHLLSSTNCHQLSTTNCSGTNQLSPTNCHQPMTSPGGRIYAPVLAGAGGSPPLFRCDLRARCLKTLCFIGFVGVEDPEFGQWRNAGKNRGFYNCAPRGRA